jgi:hypothetical protein
MFTLLNTFTLRYSTLVYITYSCTLYTPSICMDILLEFRDLRVQFLVLYWYIYYSPGYLVRL